IPTASARATTASTLAWLAAPTRALRVQLCCARMPPHEKTDMSISVRPKRRYSTVGLGRLSARRRQLDDEVGVRRGNDLGRVNQRGVQHADRRVDGGLD